MKLPDLPTTRPQVTQCHAHVELIETDHLSPTLCIIVDIRYMDLLFTGPKCQSSTYSMSESNSETRNPAVRLLFSAVLDLPTVPDGSHAPRRDPIFVPVQAGVVVLITSHDF